MSGGMDSRCSSPPPDFEGHEHRFLETPEFKKPIISFLLSFYTTGPYAGNHQNCEFLKLIVVNVVYAF